MNIITETETKTEIKRTQGLPDNDDYNNPIVRENRIKRILNLSDKDIEILTNMTKQFFDLCNNDYNNYEIGCKDDSVNQRL